MSRRTAILTLVREGRNVAEITAATGLSRKWVYQVTEAAGVKPARVPYKRLRGTVDLVRRVRRNRTPLYRVVIPASALRAAGLDTQTKLAYRVVGETVIFERVTQGELR